NITNLNGNISFNQVITNMGTNLPPLPLCISNTTLNPTNLTATNITVTNITCRTYVITEFVPTAIPDVDYDSSQAAGTIIFDDFQMSSNLSFTIKNAVRHHVNRVL